MKLDLKAIVSAIWLPFVVWAVAVIIVAFGGRQPGVVCATPVAWLMALWVGLRSVAHSRSEQKSARLTEAALEIHLIFPRRTTTSLQRSNGW